MKKWIPTTDLLTLRRMGKLQEEMGELQEVTGRVIIQGIDEIDPGTGISNRVRLTREIADVYAQLDETVERLGLYQDEIAVRRAHKRQLMAEWEAMVEGDGDGDHG